MSTTKKFDISKLVLRAKKKDRRRNKDRDNKRIPLVRAWLHGEVSGAACAAATRTSTTAWFFYVSGLVRTLAKEGRLRELEQPEKETP